MLQKQINGDITVTKKMLKQIPFVLTLKAELFFHFCIVLWDRFILY